MEIFISFTGNQKMFKLFLKVFCDFQFFREIFPTHFTSQCPKCLFHMNNHKDAAGWVIYVERVSRWTEPQGSIYKKGTYFFFIPRQGFSLLRQLLLNPRLKEMSGFPSSPIYLVKNLRSTALQVELIGIFNKTLH